MENNRFAIGARLDVAFDGEAASDRGFGRPEGVFDHPWLLMQAAVGDRTLDQP